jgi:transcriptional regulator with XRE-family HTH domain
MAKRKGRPRKKLDDSVFSNRVAAHIIELMKKKGITVEVLHERMQQIGFERKIETVKKWLQGQNPIDIEALPAIAFALQSKPRLLVPNEPAPEL